MPAEDSRRISLRLWIALGLLVCAFGAAAWLRHAADLEWSAASIRELVDGFGLWAPVILVLLITFRALLLIPSQVLLTAGGLLFGAVRGTLYGALGLTLAALIQFFVVHWTGVDALRAQLPARFDGAVGLAQSRAGVGALAVLSGYPAGPITLFHMAAAVAGMQLASFLGAIAIGSLVRSGTYSFFGSTLFQGDRLLLGGLAIAAAAALPFLHPRTRGWLRQGFARERPSDPTE